MGAVFCRGGLAPLFRCPERVECFFFPLQVTHILSFLLLVFCVSCFFLFSLLVPFFLFLGLLIFFSHLHPVKLQPPIQVRPELLRRQQDEPHEGKPAALQRDHQQQVVHRHPRHPAPEQGGSLPRENPRGGPQRFVSGLHRCVLVSLPLFFFFFFLFTFSLFLSLSLPLSLFLDMCLFVCHGVDALRKLRKCGASNCAGGADFDKAVDFIANKFRDFNKNPDRRIFVEITCATSTREIRCPPSPSPVILSLSLSLFDLSL